MKKIKLNKEDKAYDKGFETGVKLGKRLMAERRLEYLRREIRKAKISYSEILELQSLAEYIDKDDIELLEWAGVPEYDILTEEEKADIFEK